MTKYMLDEPLYVGCFNTVHLLGVLCSINQHFSCLIITNMLHWFLYLCVTFIKLKSVPTSTNLPFSQPLCLPLCQAPLLRSLLTCVKSLRVLPVSLSLWPNVPCASCSSCNFIICQWPRRHLQSAALSVLHETTENPWLSGYWHIIAIRSHRGK